MRTRVSSYFARNTSLGEKTRLLVTNIEKIRYVLVNSEVESLLLEAAFIKKYNPLFNVRLTDGKDYPLIRITVNDEYPKVLIARKQSDPKSLYFGPYPNTRAMRMVIATIRKIFPFLSTYSHPKGFCLYFHIGLCPCPQIYKTHQKKASYGKTIKYIIDFLNGKTQKIIINLEKERNNLVSTEYFEKARLIQQKIDAIKLITSPFYKPFEYEVNPNLTEDLRKSEINDLVLQLKKNGVNVEKLQRIECYDISNISGSKATGSMVVFENGEKDTSLYRRFRIKTKTPGPNDYLMLKEVLTRRLNHAEWKMPDLIIVDGGKGQVSYALSAVSEKKMNIPVVGLAKRFEIIITNTFKEVRLPYDSEALKLVMRIRDEAHRFAITYHRKLRATLTDV